MTPSYFCAGAHLEQLTLAPMDKIEGYVKLPGSKSLSNRILLLAALSKGKTLVKNLLVGSHLPMPFMQSTLQTIAPACVARMTRWLYCHATGQRGYSVHGWGLKGAWG